MLGFDHVIGPIVVLDDGVVGGLTTERPLLDGFKFTESAALLETLGIAWNDVVAVGDSPAEAEIFQHAGLSIAIEIPQGLAGLPDSRS